MTNKFNQIIKNIKKIEKQITKLNKKFEILKEKCYNVNNRSNFQKGLIMENLEKVNVFDVAKYLLDNCPQKYGTGITQMQKLLYYAQGEHLIRYQQPLFTEEIQAWPLGPVVAHVYYQFVKCRSEKKDFFEYNCSKKILTKKILDILDLVLKKHGYKEPQTLIEQTHNEDPWKNTYHPNKKFSNSVISHEKIYLFFQNQK
ncbi:Panacea domain-containing protein [Candidatus Phytoplasma solani]|uniref:Antitoxin SocA-like Panacea domain-containing protein n=1 Tax=Candidatus Phytoplasma solani TaxID=69896 RepID=A0A421NXC0_9MOLU|nr:type II toxin-antitoxin system antitoxin SocA domain-containing protein [Candidatus Phytoplasma solani]RMI87602.1 hypothetical protein PSSA1_v1c6930 [Candidatus Phytoplasma solani]RMI88646.1 hypothetical protein PSSA1_v1c3750 [Candidatus Phytoplasma solani]RMI89227.1 hypothetical protein PSSA1_v1c1070 [Candidatus Phytoplasma solani]